MLKFLFLGIGIMLLIEGFLYAAFPNQMKKIKQMALQLDNEKLRNIAIIFSIIGFVLIYTIIAMTIRTHAEIVFKNLGFPFNQFAILPAAKP